VIVHRGSGEQNPGAIAGPREEEEEKVEEKKEESSLPRAGVGRKSAEREDKLPRQGR